MTRITGIQGSVVAATGGGSRDQAPSPRDAKTATGRALIPLQPIARNDTTPRTRPQAPFLAHLIATDEKLPQTRERRRAEPQDAIAAYAAANAGPAMPVGRTFARTL